MLHILFVVHQRNPQKLVFNREEKKEFTVIKISYLLDDLYRLNKVSSFFSVEM